MTAIPQQLETELLQRSSQGTVKGCQFQLADSQYELDIQLNRLDSIGAEIDSVSLTLLQAHSIDLQAWAERLTAKLTYLLEGLGLVEMDPTSGAAIIRSNPPTTNGNQSQYYELMLENLSGQAVEVARYEIAKGTPGRTRVSMQLTTQVLVRLVKDLIDTAP